MNPSCRIVINGNSLTSEPLNPYPPTFRGLIKVYKQYAAIRPVVSHRNTPGHNVAKFLKSSLVIHSNLHLFLT